MRRRRIRVVLLALAAAWFAAAGLAAEYGDVKMPRQAQGMDDIAPAVFPHWIHRMQYKCAACHDELFKMKAGSTKVTMEEFQDGKSCGTCHNGKTAFESNFDTCTRCHQSK